jgi:amino acid transporter
MNRQSLPSTRANEDETEEPKQAQSPAYAITLAGVFSFGLANLLQQFVEQKELLLAITALVAALCVGLWEAAKQWSLRDRRINRWESFTLNTIVLFKLLAFFVCVTIAMQIVLDLFVTSTVKLPNLILMLAGLLMVALSFVPFVSDTILILPHLRYSLKLRGTRRRRIKKRKHGKIGV